MTRSRDRTTLGVLVIDSLDEPHRSVAGDYGALYSTLFEAAGATVEIVDARVDALPDPDTCDGWVIGGSRQSVGDDLPWLHRLESWVGDALDARTPLVGICFGHQLIAHCAGSRVERAASGWSIGAVEYRLVDAAARVGVDAGARPPVPGAFRLIASHRDQVVAAPPAAEVFASAPHCPVAGYTIGDHVTCVQGHPEFPAPLAESLYRSRVELIGATEVADAIASLDRPTDGAAIASWLVERVAAANGG